MKYINIYIVDYLIYHCAMMLRACDLYIWCCSHIFIQQYCALGGVLYRGGFFWFTQYGAIDSIIGGMRRCKMLTVGVNVAIIPNKKIIRIRPKVNASTTNESANAWTVSFGRTLGIWSIETRWIQQLIVVDIPLLRRTNSIAVVIGWLV